MTINTVPFFTNTKQKTYERSNIKDLFAYLFIYMPFVPKAIKNKININGGNHFRLLIIEKICARKKSRFENLAFNFNSLQ